MPRMVSTKKTQIKQFNNIPPTTPEAQEALNIHLAENLAEQQLRDGTASAQVITHYLKLGSMKAELELEQLRSDIDLKKAKAQALESQKRTEEMYAQAIEAMKTYMGAFDEDI